MLLVIVIWLLGAVAGLYLHLKTQAPHINLLDLALMLALGPVWLTVLLGFVALKAFVVLESVTIWKRK